MTIIIDPAGGGSDVGSTTNNIIEKEFNLNLSKYIGNKLKENGFNVYLTRDDDSLLSGADRVTKIKSIVGADDDVIILSNRLNKQGENGTEIIYALRNNDNLAKKIAMSLENAGQNVNKYYQRRLPSDLSSDYDYIIRNTIPYQTLIIRYNYDDSDALNNYKILGDSIVNALLDFLVVPNTYTVKKGDTLYSIARKYNTTVNAIKNLNNLSSSLLSVGQTLKIPKKETDTEENTSTITYTVKSGDTLYSIAKRYNTTVNAIKDLNNLTSNTLSIGKVLKIPSTTTTVTYTVKSGDTLYGIARKYNTTVNAIKNLNNLSSSLLSIGQILKIPKN